MKALFAAVIALGLVASASPQPASAGPNANAKIVLDVRPPLSPDLGKCRYRPRCSSMTTQASLYPSIYNVFVLVTDAEATPGIAGVQFGITYGSGSLDGIGLDIWGWVLCATLETQQASPMWPESGGGILVTWDPANACQRQEPGGTGTGVVANVGYFYCGAYSDAVLAITPRPVDGVSKVISCAGEEDIIEGGGGSPAPSHLGRAGFGTGAGYNPCGLATPVQPVTWTGIKATYK